MLPLQIHAHTHTHTHTHTHSHTHSDCGKKGDCCSDYAELCANSNTRSNQQKGLFGGGGLDMFSLNAMTGNSLVHPFLTFFVGLEFLLLAGHSHILTLTHSHSQTGFG
jgi:hypothetical protein